MEDLSQRCDLHSTRREQERERRRMRDRERRQSMTEEQRQMHLARRRKNYQLRRQKIKHLEVGYQSAPKGAASSSDIVERFEEQATPDTSELGLECNDIIPVGIDHVLQKINIEQSRSGGTESLAYDLAKLCRRLRLNHVKHFARSLKRPICKSTQAVRLINIKRLARTVKNGFEEELDKKHQCESDAQQNLLKGEAQLCTDVSNSEK